MDEIITVEATNYFSDKLEKEGPVPLFQYLIDLGARFTEIIGPPDEYMDRIKGYYEKPERGHYRFYFADFEYGLVVRTEYLFLFSDLDFNEKHKNEFCAATLFDLTKRLIAKYSFKYGYFDLSGNDDLTEKIVAATQLKRIYWANYYGRPYVEKYGKDFLLGAP